MKVAERRKAIINLLLASKSPISGGKWSERMKEVFLSQGSQWDDKIKQKLKLRVAESLPNNLEEILIRQKAGFIDGVVLQVEQMLNK